MSAGTKKSARQSAGTYEKMIDVWHSHMDWEDSVYTTWGRSHRGAEDLYQCFAPNPTSKEKMTDVLM
jgi:hypothetical protein